MYARSAWVDDIEIEPGENEMAQRIAWIILVDAINRSMMCESEGAAIKKTNHAFRAMAEARRWLMDDDDTAPGTMLDNGMVSGATRNSCLSVLQINKMALKRILGRLWSIVDEDMGDTLWAELKSVRGPARRERRINEEKKKNKVSGNRKMAAINRYKLVTDALCAREASMEWVK